MTKCDDLSLWGWDRKVFSIIHYWKELLILSKDSSGSLVCKKIKKTGSSLEIHNFKDILFQIR